MKMLWVNPCFLDYRVAVYDSILRLNPEFYLVYSGTLTHKRVSNKVMDKIGCNAIALKKELSVTFGNTKSDMANSSLTIKYPRGLIATLREIKPDIVICEGFFNWSHYVLFEAKKMKIPTIVVYERTIYVERNAPFWRVWARKMLKPFISGFIINGRLTREYLEYLGFGDKPFLEKCMAADSNGLSQQVLKLSSSQKENIRNELKLSNKKQGLCYLFVGQIVYRKGLHEFLPAWIKHAERYPDDRLLLVGEGCLLDNYKKEYASCSSIFFCGGVDYNEIYKYYAIADVFVLPTLEDNWSLVIPEAMACGLPVATSIYNGCYPELVQDGVNGFIFDPWQEESILNVLQKFHKVDLKEFTLASINIEKDYTPEKVAKRIVDFCYELKAKKDSKIVND